MNTAISPSQILVPFKDGVKLLRSHEASASSTAQKLSDFKSAPMNVFITDLENRIQYVNDRMLVISNFYSHIDAIGRTIESIVKDKSIVRNIFSNNELVIKNQCTHIIDEEVLLKDDAMFNALSFKLPCYDTAEKLQGIFGFGIITHGHYAQSLSECLNYLLKTNLLPNKNNQAKLNFNSIMLENNLTKRQFEIATEIVRGKTAKQIAAKLFLSKRTVEHHIDNMRLIFNAQSKPELIDKLFNHFFEPN